MSCPIQDGSSLAGSSVAQLSATMTTHRNCTVEMTNHSEEVLQNPNHYCHSGYCYTPLPSIIEPRTRDAFCFSKTADTATGSVGVFAYQLGNSARIAVMFSVPYDYNLYENWFGLAVIEDGVTVDETLYESMYNSAEWSHRPDRQRAKAKSGTNLAIDWNGWRVNATMSEAKRAILHVEVMPGGGGGFPNPHHHHHHYQ